MEQAIQTRRRRDVALPREQRRCSTLVARVTPDLRQFIDEEAAARCWSVSQYIERVLTDVARGARQPPPLRATPADAGD